MLEKSSFSLVIIEIPPSCKINPPFFTVFHDFQGPKNGSVGPLKSTHTIVRPLSPRLPIELGHLSMPGATCGDSNSSIYMSYLSITYLPTYLPIYLPTYLSTYLPIFLPTYLPINKERKKERKEEMYMYIIIIL
jgi:hypothetical protein